MAIAAMLASLTDGPAYAQSDPNLSRAILILKSESTPATNVTRTAFRLTGPHVEAGKGEKLKVEPAHAAVVGNHTAETRPSIKEQKAATDVAASKANTNSPPTIKTASLERTDASRKAALRRQLGELQAQRRWIEEEEYSLRFAVLEVEGNAR